MPLLGLIKQYIVEYYSNPVKVNTMSNKNNTTDSALDDVIYQQLRSLANKMMAKERQNHTLSPTDLVHEAFIKLSSSDMTFADQKHYFRTLARQMHRVLIDYSRYKAADKNKAQAVLYTDALGLVENNISDFVHINDAINELAELDERSAQSIELVYFTNLPQSQAAELMEISIATLERDLKFGRAFINEYIHNLGKQNSGN